MFVIGLSSTIIPNVGQHTLHTTNTKKCKHTHLKKVNVYTFTLKVMGVWKCMCKYMHARNTLFKYWTKFVEFDSL